MGRILHPLFALLASVTRQELARQVAYLREENRLLRARLPDRLIATPQERRRLLRFGRKLGAKLKELISMVSYQTFQRWVREAERNHTEKQKAAATPKRKPGRPRTPEEIREFVLRLGRENSWGYTRILGELRKMGIRRISRQTVKNILKEAGLTPEPRGEDSWDAFLSRHAATLWQCDFVSKPMWTLKGLVELDFVVFLHLGSRRCWITPSTVSPDSAWVSQQARNFLMVSAEQDLPATIVMRDNDVKYPPGFDEALKAADVQVKRNTPRSPNLRAHVERFIQSLKVECLDAFVVVSPKHLNHVLKEWEAHYNGERPHSARDHLLRGGRSRLQSPPRFRLARSPANSGWADC